MPRKKAIPDNIPTTYKYKGEQVLIESNYVYEVDVYLIQKNRANILCSRTYISDKELKVKDVEIIKRGKDYNIQRFITLVGAPIEFIQENNLPIYELYKKKRNEKRKSTVSH